MGACLTNTSGLQNCHSQTHFEHQRAAKQALPKRSLHAQDTIVKTALKTLGKAVEVVVQFRIPFAAVSSKGLRVGTPFDYVNGSCVDLTRWVQDMILKWRWSLLAYSFWNPLYNVQHRSKEEI